MEQDLYKFYSTIDMLDSAKKVFPHILPFMSGIERIGDLGCGMGAWCRVFEDNGFENYTLYDHPSLDRSQLLVTKKNAFLPIDLDQCVPPEESFDLIICTEVLEHFIESQALKLLDWICNTTPIVLFSAAVPRQEGVGHINEQWHFYWHERFKVRGFNFYDGFKTGYFEDKSILYHQRQNLFLYYNNSKAHLFNQLMNITTPDMILVDRYILEKPFGVRESVKELASSIRRSIESRFK